LKSGLKGKVFVRATVQVVYWRALRQPSSLISG
jgi:hypothetical protein